MFKVALVIIARRGKQPKWPPIGESAEHVLFLYSGKAILRLTIQTNLANSIFSKMKQTHGKLPDPH